MDITNYGIAFNDIPSYYIRSPKTCLNCKTTFKPDERYVIAYDNGIYACECPTCKQILLWKRRESNE